MLTFIFDKKTFTFLCDYLIHLRNYLSKNFNIPSQEINTTINHINTIDCKTWSDIIFVQYINAPLYRKIIQTPITGTHRRIFLLNTEQATNSTYLTKVLADISKYNPFIIDYSLENIEILRSKCPSNIFIHFPFPFQLPTSVQPKKFQTVSLCSSPYRKAIINNIKKSSGVQVEDFNHKWGAERDHLIASSQVLINIHYVLSSYNIFESIRCYHALELGTLVVSQNSINNNIDPFKEYIIFVPEGDLAKTVKELVDNWTQISDKVFNVECSTRVAEKMLSIYTNSINRIKELP